MFIQVLSLLVLTPLCLLSQEHEATHDEATQETTHEGNQEESFDPGSFIFGHIGDAYDWHILTVNDFHLTVPLPVIVFSRTSGLHCFFSSKFHHGHSSYKGFEIAREGKYEGKVVEVLADGEVIRPLDLSISKNVFAVFISLGLMLWVFIAVARLYRKRKGKAPKGMQSFVEPIILFIRDDIAKPSIGEGKYERFMPYLLTLFFFVWINNMMGLIPIFPGGANVTGNIAVTAALALFTFVITTVNGNRHYWQEILNAPGVPWWLKLPVPLMPVIEILGMLTKPFVLMVRLFANISAGHIIALGFFSLIFIFGDMQPALGYGVSPVSILFTMFMTVLELLVALIQAYVFTLLSALYFGMATAEHH